MASWSWSGTLNGVAVSGSFAMVLPGHDREAGTGTGAAWQDPSLPSSDTNYAALSFPSPSEILPTQCPLAFGYNTPSQSVVIPGLGTVTLIVSFTSFGHDVRGGNCDGTFSGTTFIFPIDHHALWQVNDGGGGTGTQSAYDTSPHTAGAYTIQINSASVFFPESHTYKNRMIYGPCGYCAEEPNPDLCYLSTLTRTLASGQPTGDIVPPAGTIITTYPDAFYNYSLNRVVKQEHIDYTQYASADSPVWWIDSGYSSCPSFYMQLQSFIDPCPTRWVKVVCPPHDLIRRFEDMPGPVEVSSLGPDIEEVLDVSLSPGGTVDATYCGLYLSTTTTYNGLFTPCDGSPPFAVQGNSLIAGAVNIYSPGGPPWFIPTYLSTGIISGITLGHACGAVLVDTSEVAMWEVCMSDGTSRCALLLSDPGPAPTLTAGRWYRDDMGRVWKAVAVNASCAGDVMCVASVTEVPAFTVTFCDDTGSQVFLDDMGVFTGASTGDAFLRIADGLKYKFVYSADSPDCPASLFGDATPTACPEVEGLWCVNVAPCAGGSYANYCVSGTAPADSSTWYDPGTDAYFSVALVTAIASCDECSAFIASGTWDSFGFTSVPGGCP